MEMGSCQMNGPGHPQNFFITTKQQTYADQWFATGVIKPGLASWNRVAIAGVFSLVRNEHSLPSSFRSKTEELKKYIISFADSLIVNASTNAFATVMGGSRKDFEWGSNSVAANQGIVCINAYLISHDKKYLEAALGNADYILGRNATGYCFLTGSGTKSDPETPSSAFCGRWDRRSGTRTSCRRS